MFKLARIVALALAAWASLLLVLATAVEVVRRNPDVFSQLGW